VPGQLAPFSAALLAGSSAAMAARGARHVLGGILMEPSAELPKMRVPDDMSKWICTKRALS
jgi:hypothetical protein